MVKTSDRLSNKIIDVETSKLNQDLNRLVELKTVFEQAKEAFEVWKEACLLKMQEQNCKKFVTTNNHTVSIVQNTGYKKLSFNQEACKQDKQLLEELILRKIVEKKEVLPYSYLNIH